MPRNTKTVSIPEWGYEEMVELRKLLTRFGLAAFPEAMQHEAGVRLADDVEAFSRGTTLALAAWVLRHVAESTLRDRGLLGEIASHEPVDE